MMAILTPEALAKIKAEADDALLGDMVVSARTVEPAIKQAEDMLHARLDDTGCVVTGGGVTITRKIERGAYTVTNPVAVYNELHSMMSADHIAPLLGYPVTKIKGGIAESMGIPKSGRRASMTAETVFAAKLAPYFEQGTRKKLIFS